MVNLKNTTHYEDYLLDALSARKPTPFEHSELIHLVKRLDDLIDECEEEYLRSEIGDLSCEVDDLNDTIGYHEATICNLQKIIDSHEITIGELEEKITELEQELVEALND